MSKKATTKKSEQKDAAASEKLRKEALAVTDQNLAAIDAKERGEAPVASVKDDAKPATKKGKPAKGKATKPAKAPKREGKMSGLDAAAKVLAAASEPMNAKQIVEAMASKELWKSDAATPHATIYAAMIREITAKGKDAPFKKTDRGLFTATGKGA